MIEICKHGNPLINSCSFCKFEMIERESMPGRWIPNAKNGPALPTLRCEKCGYPTVYADVLRRHTCDDMVQLPAEKTDVELIDRLYERSTLAVEGRYAEVVAQKLIDSLKLTSSSDKDETDRAICAINGFASHQVERTEQTSFVDKVKRFSSNFKNKQASRRSTSTPSASEYFRRQQVSVRLQQDIANLQSDDHAADAAKIEASVYAERMVDLGIDLSRYTGQDMYDLAFVIGNYGAKADIIPARNPELGQKLQTDMIMVTPDNISALSEENRNTLKRLDCYLEQAGIASPLTLDAA